MFAAWIATFDRRCWGWICVSLVIHALALAVLLRQPAPVFVRPSPMMAGARGTSFAEVYLPSDYASHSEPASSRLALPAARPHAKQRNRTKSAAGRNEKNVPAGDTVQTARAGSPFGSLSEGTIQGYDVRPAIPVVFPDPNRSELPPGTQGDVIVEVTIDTGGNVVGARLLQGLGPGIDDKVMAVVRRWHFTAATRDGVPIFSQHDVHFHFPK